MTEKGTKVIIYNLWEDEHGRVELDFESDRHVSFNAQETFICNDFCRNVHTTSPFAIIIIEHGNIGLNIQDIQVRSEDLDERKIAMAQRYTYSRHYLTYQHSLRVQYSILWPLCGLCRWY